MYRIGSSRWALNALHRSEGWGKLVGGFGREGGRGTGMGERGEMKVQGPCSRPSFGVEVCLISLKLEVKGSHNKYHDSFKNYFKNSGITYNQIWH